MVIVFKLTDRMHNMRTNGASKNRDWPDLKWLRYTVPTACTPTACTPTNFFGACYYEFFFFDNFFDEILDEFF